MATNSKRIYLDYAATTPLDPKVEKVMLPYFSKMFGNPGSLHFFGREALSAVDVAREKIAGLLGAYFREIIFTGSATEANNLVLRGVVKASRVKDPNIVISSLEHPSVFETAASLERDGVEIRKVAVNKDGSVDTGSLKGKLDGNTVLVSVMYANNELGTILPVREISEIIRKFREGNDSVYPLFHSDAVQAFQYLDCRPDELGLDFMTLSAHKIYGPKGIGLLYKREMPGPGNLSPVMTGGDQEFGLRPGTENVASIVGFAESLKLASERREKEYERMKELGLYFCKEAENMSEGIEINGPAPEKKLPNVHNVYFPGKKAGELLMEFDLAGISVSAGSACKTRSPKESRVVSSVYSEERAASSVRFSFGRGTGRKEIDRALSIISKVLSK